MSRAHPSRQRQLSPIHTMNKLQSLTVIVLLLIYCTDLLGQDTDAQTPSAVAPTSRQALEVDYQAELDKWMLQAYEGDRDAQFKVGALFTNDQFQTADMEQAVYWYKQAARQGHALAQYNLGHQYLTGVGVKRNEAEAMKWWLKAAEQGHPLAQFNIGRAYYLGIGLDEDHSQSKLWFRRAAKNNEPKSIDILKQLNWATDEAVALTSDTSSKPSSQDTKLSLEQLAGQSNSQTPTTPLQQTETEAEADTTPALKEAEDALQAPSTPIAVYTNPAKRSVLIAILDIRNQLVSASSTPEWTKVTNPNGFPVWVHQDFIEVADDIGMISGNAVNARSVPLITNGSIVGQLNDGETLAVLDKRNDWYRVRSPNRFYAWVKTDDFQAKAQAESEPINTSTSNVVSAETAKRFNDNDWLFSQTSDNYTLQLASFDDPAKVAEFRSRKKFANNLKLHEFTSSSKGKKWTYFAYGSYPNSDEAKQAREQIGQKLAWIRSFGKLQQNRCIAWKKQIPAPKELNKYCS